MTTAGQVTAEQEAERRDAFVGRLFQSILGAMDLYNIYLGDRLDLYRQLVANGPATAAELAARSGIHERYAREWLEQQAVSSILEVDDPGRDAAERRYAVPSGHDEVLLDRDSLQYLAYVGRFAACLGAAMPKVL